MEGRMKLPDPPDDEWQELVNCADMGLKLLDIKKAEGIESGAEIDRDQCLDWLARGRARQIYPRWTNDDMKVFIEAYIKSGKGDAAP
jgi:hypothetical protein